MARPPGAKEERPRDRRSYRRSNVPYGNRDRVISEETEARIKEGYTNGKPANLLRSALQVVMPDGCWLIRKPECVPGGRHILDAQGRVDHTRMENLTRCLDEAMIGTIGPISYFRRTKLRLTRNSSVCVEYLSEDEYRTFEQDWHGEDQAQQEEAG